MHCLHPVDIGSKIILKSPITANLVKFIVRRENVIPEKMQIRARIFKENQSILGFMICKKYREGRESTQHHRHYAFWLTPSLLIRRTTITSQFIGGEYPIISARLLNRGARKLRVRRTAI